MTYICPKCLEPREQGCFNKGCPGIIDSPMSDAEKIQRLERSRDHYQEQWSKMCNENQVLLNDIEKLRAVHFEQNERLTGRAGVLEDALLTVIREVLPQNATPEAMRGWGMPWPIVANALWGGEK